MSAPTPSYCTDSSGRTAAACLSHGAQEPPGPRDRCAKSGDRGRETAAPLDRWNLILRFGGAGPARRAQAALSVRSGFRPPSSHIFFSSRLLFLLRSKTGYRNALSYWGRHYIPTCAFLIFAPSLYFGELII